jgi:hypothetical protein
MPAGGQTAVALGCTKAMVSPNLPAAKYTTVRIPIAAGLFFFWEMKFTVGVQFCPCRLDFRNEGPENYGSNIRDRREKLK